MRAFKMISLVGFAKVTGSLYATIKDHSALIVKRSCQTKTGQIRSI
jgi:hypothetical protein